MNVATQLVKYAAQIARYQAYPLLENGLQPLEDYTVGGKTYKGLNSKLLQEEQEFAEAARDMDILHQYYEASDLLYYSACIDYQKANTTLTGPELSSPVSFYAQACTMIHLVELDVQKAELAALAKYGWRSSGPGRKDEWYEIELIRNSW